MVIRCVRSHRCHLWYSSPCTCGCWFNDTKGPNWRKGSPETRAKILGHWKLHDEMWVGWKRLADHAMSLHATLSIEWALKSRLRREPTTHILTQKHGLVKYSVSGCQFGMVSIAAKTRGLPLCKAWGIWTNHPALSRALDSTHVHCQGGHPTTPVSGQDTAHSGVYPDSFAKFIHAVLTTPIADIEHMISTNTLPVVGRTAT